MQRRIRGIIFCTAMTSKPPVPSPTALPFPSSQCHRCGAPPRYITSGKGSVFIMCPVLPSKYPPQPMSGCPKFTPKKPA
ncbi:MAG TPA: hypothetical protein PLA87_09865 [Pseudomonadota bacterium]|nr:hypothetical protein [Pseudomonadota bacterium]